MHCRQASAERRLWKLSYIFNNPWFTLCKIYAQCTFKYLQIDIALPPSSANARLLETAYARNPIKILDQLNQRRTKYVTDANQRSCKTN